VVLSAIMVTTVRNNVSGSVVALHGTFLCLWWLEKNIFYEATSTDY